MVTTFLYWFTGILLLVLLWQVRKNWLLKLDIYHKNAEWRRAMQTKNKMMTTLSHEVLTPLRMISSVARREAVGVQIPDNVHESLEKIGRTADMLYQTSLSVVTWMKYEENSQSPMVDKVYPAEVAEKAADLLSYMAEGKNDRILNQIPVGMYLFTDPMILQIILLNLLSNAIKFTADGDIILDGGYDGDRMNILIKDTGMGFQQEIKEQLRLFAGTTFSTPGTHKEPGHGVGYTIIIYFLNLLGGSLDIQSSNGRGTEIFITIPKKRYL